jgi:hypothetical protein
LISFGISKKVNNLNGDLSNKYTQYILMSTQHIDARILVNNIVNPININTTYSRVNLESIDLIDFNNATTSNKELTDKYKKGGVNFIYYWTTVLKYYNTKIDNETTSLNNMPGQIIDLQNKINSWDMFLTMYNLLLIAINLALGVIIGKKVEKGIDTK